MLIATVVGPVAHIGWTETVVFRRKSWSHDNDTTSAALRTELGAGFWVGRAHLGSSARPLLFRIALPEAEIWRCYLYASLRTSRMYWLN